VDDRDPVILQETVVASLRLLGPLARLVARRDRGDDGDVQVEGGGDSDLVEPLVSKHQQSFSRSAMLTGPSRSHSRLSFVGRCPVIPIFPTPMLDLRVISAILRES
jgi:hypothetical protein